MILGTSASMLEGGMGISRDGSVMGGTTLGGNVKETVKSKVISIVNKG